jgi:flagellar motor switch protein FliM
MAYESFLSQNEVDAVLASMTGEDVRDDQGTALAASGVRPYDLGSPDRIVRRRMQTLELINERFARLMRSVFMNFMRRNADISVGQIQVMKYSEFERNLPVPSNLNMVKLPPLRGVSLFAFDPTLVFLIIENMFGGHGRTNTRVEGRDFTATEQRIIQRLLNHTLEAYTKAWEGVFQIGHSYMRSEMHTKFASVTDSHEVVIVTPIRIEFGALGGSLNVCLPYSMIEPIRDLLTRPYQDPSEAHDDTRWSGKLSTELRAAQMPLVAEFVTLEMSLGELMALEVGTVIPFELPKTITATINQVPVLECGYGTSADGKRYAVSVMRHLDTATPEFITENLK